MAGVADIWCCLLLLFLYRVSLGWVVAGERGYVTAGDLAPEEVLHGVDAVCALFIDVTRNVRAWFGLEGMRLGAEEESVGGCWEYS